ncbi:MAG TPA: hypothetical protein PKA32_02465 [Candidatus Gracilibacteria bacterium]|nr:hypothetical protein [Candidatus Gracilibacteria bacterium]
MTVPKENTSAEVSLNPFPSPERKNPSDYGTIEEYVSIVTPEAFSFHCIDKAIAVARNPEYSKECMDHTAMGIFYFAVKTDPYLKAAKESREDLDDVCFEMDENADALALLKTLLEIRSHFHKH